MSDNPFINRINNRPIGSTGRKSEKRVIAELGAKATLNSGAVRGSKGDATLKNFRLEMKSSTSKTMPLELAWLSKISQEAVSRGQVPAVVISFVDQQGVAIMQQNAEWVMIPRSIFKELIDTGD